MAQLPLLVFPSPADAPKEKLPGGGGKFRKPSHSDQAQRVSGQLQRLQESLNRKAMSLQGNVHGLQPEQALVIETVGPIDNFVKAVKKIDGLEWLGELQLEGIKPEFGFADEKQPEKLLKGQLFLVMSDQAALRQIRSLFEKWKTNPQITFDRGLAPLKTAFTHLHTIRPWDAEDRLRDTGLEEDWLQREAEGQESVPFEAELWFHDQENRRRTGEDYFREKVLEIGGDVETQCIIPEIRYHGVLGRIPIQSAREIAARQDVKVLKCEDVMFLRPVGQCAFPPAVENESVEGSDPQEWGLGSAPQGEPVVALLDGLPLANHRLLNQRVIIDDPDNFEIDYQAAARVHGTVMASLLCHGDLDGPREPAARPVYARPILRPVQDYFGRFWEMIPENVLPVDLIHRAVRRMFEEEGSEPAAAPHIRVINLSVCDRMRPFVRELSTWARLLDWLAWKYNVLFVVSAGNHGQDIILPIPRSDQANLSPEERERAIIKFLANDTRNRRLLAPAETFNGVTVGATHDDYSANGQPPQQIDPFARQDLPAVYSAHGPGYRRTIKPDFFLPGGRQFLREKPGNTHQQATLELTQFTRPPGQRVAAPGPGGDLSRTLHSRGTSNATALASHAAGKIYGVLEDIRSKADGEVAVEYDAVLIKALLAHGASHGPVGVHLKEILCNPNNSRKIKEFLGRFLGYGQADIGKVIACTEQRVTVLGVGTLENDEGHVFKLPLPPSLSATTTKRRLTITLAWFTPINSSRQNYRVAHLWFNPKNELAPNRQEADDKAVRRGALQHEILEGEKAYAFQDGESIAIQVNCRDDAGEIIQPVRYGLAVTLEVAEGIDIAIYQEVRNRLRIPIREISTIG